MKRPSPNSKDLKAPPSKSSRSDSEDEITDCNSNSGTSSSSSSSNPNASRCETSTVSLQHKFTSFSIVDILTQPRNPGSWPAPHLSHFPWAEDFKPTASTSPNCKDEAFRFPCRDGVVMVSSKVSNSSEMEIGDTNCSPPAACDVQNELVEGSEDQSTTTTLNCEEEREVRVANAASDAAGDVQKVENEESENGFFASGQETDMQLGHGSSMSGAQKYVENRTASDQKSDAELETDSNNVQDSTSELHGGSTDTDELSDINDDTVECDEIVTTAKQIVTDVIACDLNRCNKQGQSVKEKEEFSSLHATGVSLLKSAKKLVIISNAPRYYSDHAIPDASRPIPSEFTTAAAKNASIEKYYTKVKDTEQRLVFQVGSAAAPSETNDVTTLSPQRANNRTPVPNLEENFRPSPTVVGIGQGIFSGIQEFNPIPKLFVSHRDSPLPKLDWAEHTDVWDVMLEKERTYNLRSPLCMDRHPTLTARTRAVLLDWINEVSEAFRSHRESYYLAVDFFDRYMAVARNVTKGQLQLIGISCLLMSTKMEEIYPPKIQEFVYVCDGACTADEILVMELIIMKALKFDLTPHTSCFWVNIYLQLLNYDERKKDCLVLPQYSQHAYIQIMRLLDLCTLDIESLRFNYSVLAAAAMYHISTEQLTLFASNYQWSDIEACADWMSPFATTVRQLGPVALSIPESIPAENAHLIQVHGANISLLESVHQCIKNMEESARSSPEPSPKHGVITPPQSTNPKSTTPPSSPAKVLQEPPIVALQPNFQSLSPEHNVLTDLAKYSRCVGSEDEQENNDPHSSTPPHLARNFPPSPVS